MVETKQASYINLLDFRKFLDSKEPKLGEKFWDHVVDTKVGNQVFTNDTFHLYPVSCIDPRMDGVYHMKGLTRAEANTIYSYLKDLPEVSTGFILFEFSW